MIDEAEQRKQSVVVEYFRGYPSLYKWFKRFYDDATALETLGGLLFGAADLGHLGADEPVLVLKDWLRGCGCNFVARIDEYLTQWIALPADQHREHSDGMVALAWQRAGDIVDSTSAYRLVRSAAELRRVVMDPECRQYLSSLPTTRPHDPLGRAWRAISRNQVDTSLIPEWERLCDLQPDTEEWYRGSAGISGLYELQSHDSSKPCFPQMVADGLFRLGQALSRRSQTMGNPVRDEARTEFLHVVYFATTRPLVFPEEWRRFWQEAQSKCSGDLWLTGWIEELLKRPH